MTVSSSTSKVTYAGDGSTVAFTVPFYFLNQTHLQVILRDAAGVETVQVLTTNYSVTGAGVPAGGTVTMVAAPASGQTLAILRSVPLTQLTDYVTNDPFPAQTHEDALDKLTMIAGMLNEAIGRAFTLPISVSGVSATVPTPVAGTFLGWNGAATALQNYSTNDLGVLTANSTITVQRFSGTGAQTAFTLSSSPLALNNTDVFVGGVYQSKSSYGLSGTTLTFVSAPAAGTNNIEVQWVVPTNVSVGTPTDGTVTPAKLSTGGPSWDASGNLTLTGYSASLRVQVSGSVVATNGMYLPAANTLGLSTNSGLRFQIGSAGQLGIGGATYGSAGQVLTSAGAAAAPTWSAPAATTAASQAQQEAATDNTVMATPANQHFHPGHAKAVGRFSFSLAAVTGSLSSIASSVVTWSTTHGLSTGDFVVQTAGIWPTGTGNGAGHYARSIAPTTFSLHPTYDDAQANTNIVTLSGGSGTRTLSKMTITMAHSFGLSATVPIRPVAGTPAGGPSGDSVQVRIYLASALSSTSAMVAFSVGAFALYGGVVTAGATNFLTLDYGAATVSWNFFGANPSGVVVFGDLA